MLSKKEVSITKTINGHLRLEVLYNGYVRHQLYIGYSKKEALKQFIKSIESEAKKEFINIPI
jgi:hypothetical protein